MMMALLYSMLKVVTHIRFNVLGAIAELTPAAADPYRRDAEPCHAPLAF
jgi:hypothetical protein